MEATQKLAQIPFDLYSKGLDDVNAVGNAIPSTEGAIGVRLCL
ncbi:MAG: hypothetical protein ACXV2E_00765 [Halobacteriota archaeon]